MIFLSLAALAAFASPLNFYVGTYTSPNGSQGVYRAQLDIETGKISAPALAVVANGPSYLAVSPNGKYVYASLEPTNGTIGAFRIDDRHDLILLESSGNAEGGAPCHVSVDPTGKYVYSAGYSGGNVACFPVAPDGSIGAPATNFKNGGSGPNKDRQEGPHLHSAYAVGPFVYACDLGTDEILVFRNEGGHLKSCQPRSAKVAPGGGPRHLAFHPNGKWAYANSEMLNSVTFFRRDPATGALENTQTLPTLDHAVRNTTAEVMLHPNGKLLYVSNRGDDTIAAFRVGDDGRLTAAGIFPTTVREPRGFAIDPTGNWLVVAGQNSHDVTALAIDSATGRLSPGPNKVTVHSPVCILFVK